MNRILFAVAVLFSSIASAADFNVADYGAIADGKTVCTAAIQKTIDTAAAAGGGDVVVSQGAYVTGSIFLKSHVNLRINEKGELRGVEDETAYPDMFTRVEGTEMSWPAALINICEQSDCRIYGKGVIDGQGKFWWSKYWGDDGKGGMRADYDKRNLRWAVNTDCKRARLLQVYKSHDVMIQNVTLKRSGFWTVHVCFSDHVNIDSITIRNNIGGRGPSTDGIDIDSSADILVQGCDIDCNDDAICLKSGRDADGLRVNRPTERVIIRDCVVRGGEGLITLGSETSGGIRDVEAYRLKAIGKTRAGIRLKSRPTRGGTMERINIHDIDMDGVPRPIDVDLNWYTASNQPVLPTDLKDVPPIWKLLTEPVPPEKGTPHFRDVTITHLTAKNATQAFAVTGAANSLLERFKLEDVNISAKTAGQINYADGWTLKEVSVVAKDGKHLSMDNCKNMIGDVK